ncbi:MAG: aminoacetone oxidase family FAD-binding enzyme [Bacteroidota bacterium]|nr:MAG: aminoacetone oxidase family FAD-binding enzyme [Bacteroidota bacterium]
MSKILLITHWGLSGPVVLRMSAWAAEWLNQKNYLTEVSINFLPGFNHDKVLEKFTESKIYYAKTNLVTNKLFSNIPNRLWERLIDCANIDAQIQYAQLSKKQINTLVNLLVDFRIKMSGKTTFKEEFVTCGGVHLTEINMKTMESKKIPNLFFAGEVINVDGITGGFNFQAAWSTAMIAARNIASKCNNS